MNIKILYFLFLIIIGVIESSQIYNLTNQIYKKEIAILLAISIIFIYIIVSFNSNRIVKILSAFLMFIILSLSYYSTIEIKIKEKEEDRMLRVLLIDKKIDNLRNKLLEPNKSKCDKDNKYYVNCLYLTSLEIKSFDKNAFIIKQEIENLQNEKQKILSEKISYNSVNKLIIASIVFSFFLAFSIIILIQKIQQKETYSITSLRKKGYSINDIMRKTKLSRATIYRRIKNESQ